MVTEHIDQLGRSIFLDLAPKRIISLVPSITELLYDLELFENIIGRTKFCVHPKEALQAVPKVGGTKNVSIKRVIALQPDLIIANKEENEQAQIELLGQHFPVWISDIGTFEEAMDMIRKLGFVVDRENEANEIIQKSATLLKQLQPRVTQKIAYLIWQKPYMTIGKDTYIHDILGKIGFKNIFGEQTRYPVFTLEALKERQPDRIFLSSEPFPFKQKHIEELQIEFSNIPIELVDGEAFSWYGTRFLKTFDFLKKLNL